MLLCTHIKNVHGVDYLCVYVCVFLCVCVGVYVSVSGFRAVHAACHAAQNLYNMWRRNVVKRRQFNSLV